MYFPAAGEAFSFTFAITVIFLSTEKPDASRTEEFVCSEKSSIVIEEAPLMIVSGTEGMLIQ